MAATKELVQKIIGQSHRKPTSLFCPQGVSIIYFLWYQIPVCVYFILFHCLTWLVTTESKDGSKSKGRRGAKNSATAAKVALMKLKLHASGDKGLPQVKFLLISWQHCKMMFPLTEQVIHSKKKKKQKNYTLKCAILTYFVNTFSIFFALQTERTYFQVYLPKESKVPSQPMFFCSKWSVGKVVDYAASLASLKNNNNVLTAKVMFAR